MATMAFNRAIQFFGFKPSSVNRRTTQNSRSGHSDNSRTNQCSVNSDGGKNVMSKPFSVDYLEKELEEAQRMETYYRERAEYNANKQVALKWLLNVAKVAIKKEKK